MNTVRLWLPRKFRSHYAERPEPQKKIFMNSFSNRIEVKDNLPWRKLDRDKMWKDSDDAGLRVYIEKFTVL